MTVTSETNKAQATGNGVVKVFAYTFQVPELEWMEVYLGDVLQSSGYTVSGIGAPTGGSVTFTVAPATGVIVTLLRVVPLTQEVDYQPYDPFPAEVAEGTLDKLTMITQQLQEEVSRAWRVPVDTPPGVVVAPPPYEPGLIIGWSETEEQTLVNYPGIGTFQQLVDDSEAAAAAAAASQSAAAGSASAAATSASQAAASADAAIVAKIEWKGVWSSVTAYSTHDAVENNGSSYIAIAANTNSAPPSANWELLAEKGEQGQSGTGSGNVNGPAASTVDTVALFDSTDGTYIKVGPLITDLVLVRDLGTAASADVTTSSIDATAGSVTRVGDGGILNTGNAPVIVSLDTTASMPSGLMRYSAGVTLGTTPAGAAPNGVVLIERFSATIIKQTWTDVVGGSAILPATWVRTSSGVDTWGVWVPVIQDSGWLTPTLVNSFTQDATTPLQYRKIGKTVYLVGSVKRTTPPASITDVCTLPVGYRPSKNSTLGSPIWVGVNVLAAIWAGSIGTDGAVNTGIVYNIGNAISGAGEISFNTSLVVD